MAGRVVGSVSVTVVPDAQTFSTLLRAQITPQANSLGEEIGKALSRQIAQGIRQGIIDGGASGIAPAGVAGRASGDRFAGEFDRAVRTKLEAALRSLPPVNIGVATSEAEQKVKEIGAEIRALADKRVGIDINEGEALAKIQELRDKLTEIGASAPSIQVKADALAARDQLQEILLKADEVAQKSPTIKVDLDDAGVKEGLAADAAAADVASGNFSLLTSAGIGLGPALIPVIAAVTASMIGLASVIGAVGAGIGVLGLAFSGVSKAMQDLTGEQNRQSTASAGAGRSAASSAQAQVSAAAQVKAAEESLANARANAKNAAISAAEAVQRAKRDEARAEKDAATAVAEARDKVATARQQMTQDVLSSAEAIGAAERQQAEAERTLTDAQQRATDAQTALVEARKTAQQQLEDLANQVIDSQNDQRQAELSLQTASTNLQNVQAPGSIASDQTRAQAQLDYDEAVQRLAELKTQNQRLADEKAAADAAGVEGSKAVTQAQRDLADANQGVIDAQQRGADAARNLQDVQTRAARQYAKDQRDIIDAQAAVQKAQVDGAQKIVEAQQKVSDAIRAQANQQRQSAYSVQQAIEAVASAQRSLANAGQSGGGGGGGGFDKYASDLAKLNPATVELAKFIKDQIVPAFHDLQGAAAEGLAPGFEAGIKTLLPYLPNLEDFVRRLAGAMGDLFKQASKALTSPFWKSFGDFINNEAGHTLSQFATIIGNVITGFVGLVQAFFPVTDKIGGGLVAITGRFADFGKAAGNPDSPFQTFIRYVKQEGPVVVDTFGNIFGAIRQLVIGLAPFGDVMLSMIDKVAKFIATTDPAIVGGIAAGIGGLILAMQGFGLVTKLVEGLNGAFKLFGATSSILAAGPIALVVVGIAAASVVIYELYKHSQVVHDFIDQHFLPLFRDLAGYFNTVILPMFKELGEKALKGLEEGFGYVTRALQQNKPELEELGRGLKEVADFIIRHVLPLFLDATGDTLQAAFAAIGLAIATFIAVLSTLNDAFDAFGAAAHGNWDKVHEYWSKGVRNVVSLINEFIGAINKIPGVNIPLIPLPGSYTAPTTTTSGTGNGSGVNAGGNRGVSTGGVFPGYAPGVDSIRAHLSPGEGVLVPEAVQLLGPEWVYQVNRMASAGRASSPAVRHDDHFSFGGIVGSALSGIGDVVGTATNFVLGPAEHAAISVAERGARFAIDHAGLPTEFRKMAEATVNIIGDSFKFSDGGVVPGGSLIAGTGSGVGYGSSNVIVHGGPNVTYKLDVHNNRRDIGGGEVVTSLNQMHALHGAPLLAGGS